MTDNVIGITELQAQDENDGDNDTVNPKNATSVEGSECLKETSQISVEQKNGIASHFQNSLAEEHFEDEYQIYGADEEKTLDDDYPQYAFEEIEEISEEESASNSSMNDKNIPVSQPSRSVQSVVADEKCEREKLIEAFHEACKIRQKEERKNALLNKKLLAYFRRKKLSRALQNCNADIVLENVKKYRSVLFNLNKLKGQKEELTKECDQRLGELRRAEQALMEETTKNIAEFNKLVREVGVSCQSAKTGLLLSEKVVDKYIRKMNLLREQLSASRFELFKSQDKVTALLLKTKKLEDLGDGLKVINFEQLRAETQILSEKIEERNNEITKLRRRYNSDTHMLAHVREKQSLLSQTILVQEGVFRDLQNEESSYKNYVNYIKVERDELRKKLNEMSIDCGLLDKPALLRDYDRTVEKMENVKKEVAQLNAEKNKLLEELKKAKLNAESQMAIKTDLQKFDEKLNQQRANLDKLPYPRIYQGIRPARNIDLSRYRSDWRN